MTEDDFKQVFTQANLDFSYKLSPEVIHRKTDGKISVLLFNTDDEMYEIDGIAAKIWDLLVEKQNIPAFLFQYSSEHKFPTDRICNDTVLFLQDLLKRNIIQSA